jgi:exodeoxyribonuclease V alpha subunit
VRQELEIVQRSLSIQLSDEQEKAVLMAFSNRISIITGGPGTGKTTVLNAILGVYKMIFKSGEVLLAAPTGKAARRMHESTGMPAMTIHKALRLKAEEDPEDDDGRSLSFDFVIVDEFSMVDMSLCSWLFGSLKPSASLLLVGDADQLPSVGAGNVFFEFINCNRIPVTTLNIVHRQKSGSLVARNAAKIRKGEHILDYGEDFKLLRCEDSEEAADVIKVEYMRELGRLRDLSKLQVLAPLRRKGAACSNYLNGQLRELANPPSPFKKEVKIGEKIFREGDRVMQVKNHGDVSNGEIGYIKSVKLSKDEFDPDDDFELPFNDNDDKFFEKLVDDDASYLDFDNRDKTRNPHVAVDFSDGRKVVYTFEEMDMVELSYAATIHKSQGSEYDTVIIPILDDAFMMLRRNLIYTAITRAKAKVVLVGREQSLIYAIKKNDIAKRNTILGARIVAFLSGPRNVSLFDELEEARDC